METTTDSRILTNKGQACLTVLRDDKDLVSNSQVTALRADADGNLKVADQNLSFDAFGRLLVDTENSGSMTGTQHIAAELTEALPDTTISPAYGPRPQGDTGFYGVLEFASDDPVNYVDVAVKLELVFMIGVTEQTTIVGSRVITLKPAPSGTSRIVFNTFDFQFAADQGPSPLLYKANIILQSSPAAGQKVNIQGSVEYVNCVAYGPIPPPF